MEIDAEAKRNTHRYYIWLLTCQIPSCYWNKPEEEQFYHARTLTGDTVEKTNWPVVYNRIKNEAPVVWQDSIAMAKKALNLE